MPTIRLSKRLSHGKTPAEAAKTTLTIQGSTISASAQLYEGGPAAVNASTDPLIVLMRTIDPEARASASNTTTRSTLSTARRSRDRESAICAEWIRSASRRDIHASA